MTTFLEWARHGPRLKRRWLDTLHPNDGTKLARIIAVCDGHWRTHRDIVHLTGIPNGTAGPLLTAAARKRLLLRRPAPPDADYPKHMFRPRWLYRLPGT